MQKIFFFTVWIVATVTSNVINLRSDEPGFWDNRLIKPLTYPNIDKSWRIVGGWEVERNSLPYQAALLITTTEGSGTFLCGASVITHRAVLTAAHCIERTLRAIVIVGAHQLSTDLIEPTQQRFTVQRSGYRPHQRYNSRTFENDICVLLLPSAIIFNDFVKPIELPRMPELNENSFSGEIARVR